MTCASNLTVGQPETGRPDDGRSKGLWALSRLIAVRLGVTVALLVGAIIAVSLASLVYMQSAEQAAQAIKRHDAVAAGAAADIAVLLERHRRLVEAAMTDRDESGLDKRRQSAERIGTLISTLLRNNTDTSVRRLSADFEMLVSSARRAFFAARHLDYQQAQTFTSMYARIADRLQSTVRESRDSSLRDASQTVVNLVRRGESLKFLILLTALPALFVLGPLSLLIVVSIIHRINGLTDGMRRVAVNDIAVSVADIADQDEIGEMARALEVFKQNAVTLLGNAKEIKRLNEWFDLALNNMARGLSMFDADGNMIVCNRQYLELYRLPEHLGRPGTKLSEIAAYWTAASGQSETTTEVNIDGWFQSLRGQLAGGFAFEQRQCLADGRTIVVQVQPIADGGWVDLHEDVTEADRAKQRISELASFDTLTGLANRRQFMETLESWLANIDPGQVIAVLWFDLDRFKAVNDTHGHPTGDALLRLVAERLRGTLRSGDLVARLGGDEFAIIIKTNGDGMTAAEALGGRVIATISEPFDIAGQRVSVGASVGVAFAPMHGSNAEKLLLNADVALYRAKTAGRGTVVAYSTEFEQTIKARRQLETDLRRAVELGELMLHYQPIVDLRSGRVASCEALMRWRHREQGMISPAVFIPMAEDLGLIHTLGAWALKQACIDAATWPYAIKVAVNLSASQFASKDLVSAVHDALAVSGLAADRLEVEVTETLLLQDNANTLETLTTLSRLGISIALDDFGTGYASLSYLHRFPFDKIKIDQSFIRDMLNGSDSATIVRAVVDLAHTLGLTTVAEGIETEEQLAAVWRAGGDSAQGYYFSRPVASNAIAAVIEDCNQRVMKAA